MALFFALAVTASGFALQACGGKDKAGAGTGGGKGGATTGAAGSGGTAGMTGGKGVAGNAGGSTGGGAGGAGGTGGGTAGASGGAGGSTAGAVGGTAGGAGDGGAGGTAGAAGQAGQGGTGAAAGVGGTSGAAGASGRGGTAGGAGAAGGAGGGWPFCDAQSPLPMLLAPCLAQTDASLCKNVANNCTGNQTGDPALRGALLTDKTVTLCGMTLGQPLTITLHVQGEVESKGYTGGTDQDSAAASPRANGFYTGGQPTLVDGHSVYMIRVSYPGDADQDYFLNALAPPGADGPSNTTYGIDYQARIDGRVGGTIRVVASDANCSQTRNCGPTEDADPARRCLTPIVPANVEPEARARNPSFDFDAAYNGQWIALTIKNISSP